MGMRYLLLIAVLFIGFSATAQSPFYKTLRTNKTLLYDTFTGANTTDIGNPSTYKMDKGGGWTVQSNGICGGVNTMTIQSNRALPPVAFLSTLTADAGVSDYIVSADLIIPNSNNYLGGLVIRWSTCANYWIVCIERDAAGTPYLAIVDCVSGTRTYRATVNVPGATNTTLNVKVTLNGNSITALAGTGETCNYSSSFLASSTLVGLLGYDDASTYTPAIEIDNFLVLKL